MKNLEKFFATKRKIFKCWKINASIPKGYGTRSEKYYRKYSKKNILLEKIIQDIRQYSLPIKYGMNNGVIYFSFSGIQFSFHSYMNGIKKYNGNWQGQVIVRKNNFIKKFKKHFR